MHISERSAPPLMGFRTIHLLVMTFVALAGAFLIGFSLNVHTEVQSHVDVLNPRQPMHVLVAIQGTPADPAFVGLIAVVQPVSRSLAVIPVSGTTDVFVHGHLVPLYQAVSELKPTQAVRTVAQAARMPIDHYFFLTPKDLMLVLNALYYHSPGWPKSDTPLDMLSVFGYPEGTVQPAKELHLIDKMIHRLPLISPIAAGALLQIPKTSVTNLTSYQLFLLANYVRGDQLVLGTLNAHHLVHEQGRNHG